MGSGTEGGSCGLSIGFATASGTGRSQGQMQHSMKQKKRQKMLYMHFRSFQFHLQPGQQIPFRFAKTAATVGFASPAES